MNTDRDAALLALRPTTESIDNAVNALKQEGSSDITDSFAYMLHASLRSILKLQHSTIVRLTALHLAPQRGVILQRSIKDQCALFANALKKDTALRMMIVGVVVGHFTEAELLRYTADSATKSEINKRIIELAAKRVCDAREELLAMIT